MTTPHKHADVLRAIADGLDVECRYSGDTIWKSCRNVNPIAHVNPIADAHMEWRIKPRMIVVGKHSWPEPMRAAPVVGTIYFVVSLGGLEGVVCDFKWSGYAIQEKWLSRGFCHTTKEAAEQHARALIAISQGDV